MTAPQQIAILGLALACAACATNPPAGAGGSAATDGDGGDVPAAPNDATIDLVADVPAKDGARADLDKTDSAPADTPAPPDSGGDVKVSVEPDKCQSLLACGQATCPWPPPIACLDNCALGLQGTAKVRWESLRACIVGKCNPGSCKPDDANCLVACVAAQCAAPWNACGTDGVAGSGTCKQISQCATPACGPKDGVCLAKCMQQGSKAAQTGYQQLIQCVGLVDWQKAVGKPVLSNSAKYCYGSATACLCPEINPGSGAAACATLPDCAKTCAQTDVCCLQACRAKLSPQALAQADALATCEAEKCGSCENDGACTTTCLASKCDKELEGCLCAGVPAAGSGKDKCGSSLQCLQGCDGSKDPCCLAKCMAKMDADGAQKAKAVIDCLPKCGCKEGDAGCEAPCFLFGKCSGAYNACTGDT